MSPPGSARPFQDVRTPASRRSPRPTPTVTRHVYILHAHTRRGGDPGGICPDGGGGRPPRSSRRNTEAAAQQAPGRCVPEPQPAGLCTTHRGRAAGVSLHLPGGAGGWQPPACLGASPAHTASNTSPPHTNAGAASAHAGASARPERARGHAAAPTARRHAGYLQRPRSQGPVPAGPRLAAWRVVRGGAFTSLLRALCCSWSAAP